MGQSLTQIHPYWFIQSHLLGAGITLYRNVGFHTQRGQDALALMIEGKPAGEILKVVASSLVRKDIAPGEAEQGIKARPEATKIFIIQQQSLFMLAASQAGQAQRHLMHLVVEFGLQPLVDLLATVPTITPILAIGLIAEFGANAPDRYQLVDQMVSAGGLSPNTEVSGGKVTKRSLQLGGKRNVKIPLMQVAKGYVIHASNDPLWKRWKEYKERAGYGKALKWLAGNVLEMAYYVWEHKVPCDQKAHFGMAKPNQAVEVVVVSEIAPPIAGRAGRKTPAPPSSPKKGRIADAKRTGSDASKNPPGTKATRPTRNKRQQKRATWL